MFHMERRSRNTLILIRNNASLIWTTTTTTTTRIERYRLVGLVVTASASGAEDAGFESRLHRDFSGSSHSSDFKIGTPVTTLSGARRIGSAQGLVGPVSVYCDWVR